MFLCWSPRRTFMLQSSLRSFMKTCRSWKTEKKYFFIFSFSRLVMTYRTGTVLWTAPYDDLTFLLLPGFLLGDDREDGEGDYDKQHSLTEDKHVVVQNIKTIFISKFIGKRWCSKLCKKELSTFQVKVAISTKGKTYKNNHFNKREDFQKYLFMDVPTKEERRPGTQGQAPQELHAADTIFLTLKGLSHEMYLAFMTCWSVLGLNRGRGQF